MNILHDSGLEYFWEKLKSIFILKQNLLDSVYPIGSIYMNFNDVSPSTIFGGNWERWAIGKTLIGINKNDTNLASANLTGGEKAHTLTTSEIPSHTHGQVSLTGTVFDIGSQSSGEHIWGSGVNTDRAVSGNARGYCSSSESNVYDGFQVTATHTHDTQGADAAHNNLQPYRTCYIWRRIS